MKREVYQEYGITSHGPGDYEVDHLIPLELGWSNSIKISGRSRTGPRLGTPKLKIGLLHELVCSGQLDLKTAQQAIASDWIEAYKVYVSANPPMPPLAPPAAPESPLNSDQVWVNTRSGKYWKPGSPYYGRTKRGEYMSEKEAVQKGISASERYRRMTMAVNPQIDSCS